MFKCSMNISTYSMRKTVFGHLVHSASVIIQIIILLELHKMLANGCFIDFIFHNYGVNL